jgi:diguanylate cyclase (GGDEF)-like protein/PAS domain S-box-containing protein
MSTAPIVSRIGLFESVLAHAHDGVVIAEPDATGSFRITYANDAFLALHDRALSTTLGEPIEALFENVDIDGSELGRLIHDVTEGHAVRAALMVRAHDGRTRRLRASYFEVPTDESAEGPVSARVAMYYDAEDGGAGEHFRTLIENMSETVIVLEHDATIRYANPSVMALLGYQPAELVGRSAFELGDPDQALAVRAFWNEVLGTTDHHPPVEARFVRADGEVRIIEINVLNRLHDPAVDGIIVTARDVTVRVGAEEQLRQAEERSRALVQRGSDLIVVVDEHGTITFAAESMTAVLGYPVEQLLETNVFTLVHPDDRVEALTAFTTRVADDPDLHLPVEARVRTLDGTWRRLGVYSTNLLDHPAVRGIVLHARDLTRDEEMRRSTERRFQALVQSSSDVIVVTDPGGLVTYCSPALEKLLVLPRGAMANRSLLERIDPLDRVDAAALLDRLLHESDAGDPTEVRFRLGDGSVRHIQLRGTNLLGDLDVGGLVFNGNDVTERRRAEVQLAEEAGLLEDMARGFAPAQVLEGVARMVERQLPGSRCSVGVAEEDGVIRHRSAPSLPHTLVRRLDDIEPASPLGLLVRSGLELLVVEDAVAPAEWAPLAAELVELGLVSCWGMAVMAPSDNRLLGYLTVFHPSRREPDHDELALMRRARHLAAIAIERARFEAQLEHQALYDSLTGLPNRSLLLNRIDHALSLGARHERTIGVLFIDLDNFKVINDSLGHTAGDGLLQQVAVRFATIVRTADTVGRFGGDEFLVFCEELQDEDEALVVAERIRAALHEPFTLGDAEVHVTASVGVALQRGDLTTAHDLIRDADAAMYRAKELGRDRSEVFEERLHARAVERLETERDLRTALVNGELEVHYQAQVRVADGTPLGLEALVRWNRPGVGLVLPDRFIGVAEETGLIAPLGEHVLAAAVEQLRAIDAVMPELGITMSVNVSARQLVTPRLVDLVASTIVATGIDPARLCLEVTENALLVEVDRAQSMLALLHEIGVQIAIDDFGTGYASLDYLRRFTSATTLKIDRSFVAGIEGDAHDRAIVAASVVLAQRLGLTAVAEGVETAGQLEFLQRIGCDAAQGFLIGHPVGEGDVVAVLRELAERAARR